jgi:hypothetical protein
MAKLTRRGFVKKSSVGAATLGALVAVPRLAEVEAAPQPHVTGQHEPLLAHVRNRATGEIALLVGTREVVIHDRELVMRLVKAAQ